MENELVELRDMEIKSITGSREAFKQSVRVTQDFGTQGYDKNIVKKSANIIERYRQMAELQKSMSQEQKQRKVGIFTNRESMRNSANYIEHAPLKQQRHLMTSHGNSQIRIDMK